MVKSKIGIGMYLISFVSFALIFFFQGGITEVIDKFLPESINGVGLSLINILVLWILAMYLIPILLSLMIYTFLLKRRGGAHG
jgi:hypothetical protein